MLCCRRSDGVGLRLNGSVGPRAPKLPADSRTWVSGTALSISSRISFGEASGLCDGGKTYMGPEASAVVLVGDFGGVEPSTAGGDVPGLLSGC